MKTFKAKVILTGTTVLQSVVTVNGRNRQDAETNIRVYYGKHFVCVKRMLEIV